MSTDWFRHSPTKTQLGIGYLAGVGLALLISLFGYIWYSRESLLYIIIGVSLAGALFGAIVYIGYLFLDIDLSEYFVWNVAQWTAFGLGLAIALSFAIGAAHVYLPASTLVPSLFVIIIAAGAMVGTLLGVVTGLRDQQLRMRRISQRNKVMNRVLRHNIRNSMNIVLGYADTLKTNGGSGDPESVAAIEGAAKDVLELSDSARKIDALSTEPREGPVDVVELIRDYIDAAEETFPGANLSTDLPESAVAQAGPIVRAAVQNLVENAIEHNDGTPSIRVSVSVTDGNDPRVVIGIADNGPGIPEQERRILFEDGEQPVKHGSGLGLWLVKWIADYFDGEMWFESNEPQGTIVYLELPAIQGDPAPVPAEMSEA